MIQQTQQPTADSCVSACVAMITGLDVRLVMHFFHDNYHACEIGLADILRALGLPFEQRQTGELWLPEEPGTYLTGVPSLNNRGGMHQALLTSEGDEWKLLDPNEGREGVKCYSTEDLGSICFVIEAFIDHKSLDAWRKSLQPATWKIAYLREMAAKAREAAAHADDRQSQKEDLNAAARYAAEADALEKTL